MKTKIQRTRNLIKFHLQNLGQALTSKSQQKRSASRLTEVNKEYQFQIDLDLKHDKTHLTSKTHFTFIVILFYPIFYFAIKLPKVAVQRPNTIQSQFQMGSDFCFEALVFPMNKL